MSAITPDMAPFKPEGFAWDIIRGRRTEQITSGVAGAGKSRAYLESIHACMEKYSGARAAIVRKTRASIAESALVTFENFVLPAGHYLTRGPSRTGRRSYRYENGSEIIIAGLDKPSKIMSTDFDLIYVQEAIETEESEWEALSTRLRHTAMPYRRLMGDTNPGPPSHWIKRRESRGQLELIEARHEDNPLLYDRRKGEWTELGQEYLARLDQLTGVRKDRYRFGRWVAAEGMIYDVWEPRRHHIPRFPIPVSWPQYWGVDFGYEHPFVWQAWSKDPDGRLYMHREIYFTHKLVSDHAKEIRRVLDDPTRENRDVRAPFSLITDHDAEDRATLERELKMRVTPAWKSIRPGIQAVLSRMRVDETGYPRLLFLRDSLVERDAELDDSKLPVRTVEEIESYVWKHKADGAKTEEPVDKDNHGCLVAGTKVRTRRGDIPIECIAVGDDVLTRQGYRSVLAAGRTADKAQVYTVHTDNGISITGTADHPVLTDRGFVPILELESGDSLVTEEQVWRKLSRLNGEGLYTGGTHNPQVYPTVTTSVRSAKVARSGGRCSNHTRLELKLSAQWHSEEKPRSGSAPNAANRSPLSPRSVSDSAVCRVRTVTEQTHREPVYNLTVEGTHEFIANGIVVHNCDTMRYVVCHVDGVAELKAKDVTQNIPQVERLRRIQAAQQYNRFRRR